MRYWLYKCNKEPNPTTGSCGVWLDDVFHNDDCKPWGGHGASNSYEVWNYLDEDVSAGDVVVAYQTDARCIVGYCVVTEVEGPYDARTLNLRPIERLDPPLQIHRMKHGTILAESAAINGRVMLRPLTRAEMQVVVGLASRAPRRIMRGEPPVDGWNPSDT